MEDLTLTAAEFAMSAAGMTWRWMLTRPGGAFVDDHDVGLDAADWQYEAFTDLYGWLEHYAEPLNDRQASEEAIVAAVGDWISQHVFGTIAGILVDRAPCAVRVALPAAAAELAFVPLELARVGGRPLAVQHVSLVIDIGLPRDPARPADTVREPFRQPMPPVRVLGLFSLPHGSTALNLRQERHELGQLVGDLAGLGHAIELRSLQYGATREKLADAVHDGGGWDVVHLSGHGRAGVFMLEKLDGSRDPVSGDELMDLLGPLRGRVKLVTVSSCDSGERIARRQLGLLTIPSEAADGASTVTGQEPGAAEAGQALAPDLARRLACAVVGMRYPVAEPFAAAFAHELYRLLFAKGMPLARARAAATAITAAGRATVDRPALSAGAPALYAASAIDLRLAAPRIDAPAAFTHEDTKLAGFPGQPAQFVGRVAAMSRAAQALAPRSGRSTVLIHGMAGAGKTAFALELAYTQQENFRTLIWYAAPDERADIRTTPTDLAVTIEQKIDGLEFAHLLDDVTRLRTFLPSLTEFFERNRILLVIDNADSLLTAARTWRDDRWRLVVNALTSHAGLGRLIITARHAPVATDTGSILAEPVDELSETEAVLLARELPGLRALLDGTAPPLNEATARGLARRVLKASHGHPKLLELAEGQAADPAALARSVLVVEQAWREHGSMADTRSADDPAGYLSVLGTWTRQVSQRLGPAARLLFGILCCLEPDDREQGALDDVWPHLWLALGQSGDPPPPDPEVHTIAACGLLRVERHAPIGSPANSDFVIHPAVAATGRAQADAQLHHHVDCVLGDYWSSLCAQAIAQEAAESYGWLVLYAGRAALPYLVRLRNWERARYLIQEILRRDDSRATAATLLPTLRTVADASTGDGAMRAGRLLAQALERVNDQAAQEQLRRLLSAATGAGDHRAASVLAGDLSDLLLDAAHLDRALAASEEKIDQTRLAGLGPWTVMGAKVHRLRILAIQGRADEVLAESQQLRAQMGQMLEISHGASPPKGEPDETAVPWSVREVVLDLGREAACQLQRWEDALALSAETAESQTRRGAPPTELRRTLFNDYFPLLKLSRLAEAREVLYQCRATAEADNDVATLGKTLGALADVEDAFGHGEVALDLDRAALRYKYLANDADGIAAGHHNYGSHLARHSDQVAAGLAHILAAALIRTLTGTDGLDLALRAAALLALQLPEGAAAAGTTRELREIVDQVPGAGFGVLLERLEPDPRRRSETYRLVLSRVRELQVGD